MERRTAVLRLGIAKACFPEVPLTLRAFSQLNNSRAWGADRFLTFFTASSTVLMRENLAKNLVFNKRPLCWWGFDVIQSKANQYFIDSDANTNNPSGGSIQDAGAWVH